MVASGISTMYHMNVSIMHFLFSPFDIAEDFISSIGYKIIASFILF